MRVVPCVAMPGVPSCQSFRQLNGTPAPNDLRSPSRGPSPVPTTASVAAHDDEDRHENASPGRSASPSTRLCPPCVTLQVWYSSTLENLETASLYLPAVPNPPALQRFPVASDAMPSSTREIGAQ